MEELKLLIEMVSNLPTMAIWVLIGFYSYKVICIGSIYGVIRLAISKAHDVIIAKKVEYKEVRPMLDGICITGTTDNLIAQLHRLRGRGTGIKSEYIHWQSIDWLRQAIDEKIQRDNEKNK